MGDDERTLWDDLEEARDAALDTLHNVGEAIVETAEDTVIAVNNFIHDTITTATEAVDETFGTNLAGSGVVPCPGRIEVTRETGNLRVTVVNAQNGRPIGRARVRIAGPRRHSGRSRDNGQAFYNDLPEGIYQVTVTHPLAQANATGSGTVSSGTANVRIQLRMKTFSLLLKAEGGSGQPPTIVPVDESVRMTAILSPAAEISGAWQWTTTSAKVTLASDTSDTVTINGGANPSASRDAEALSVTFTPAANTSLDPIDVQGQLTVVRVVFAQANTQRWGYDDMDNGAGAVHHVSVKRADHTFVRVTIEGGATGDNFRFTSTTANASAQSPGPASAQFDLRINGGGTNKGDATIQARALTDTGPVCADIKANCYAARSQRVTVIKVHDSRFAATNLTRATFNTATAQSRIRSWYKVAVAGVNVAPLQTKNVQFATAAMPKLIYEVGVNSTGWQAILNAVSGISGLRVVIVRDMVTVYYLREAAPAMPAGTTTTQTLRLKNEYADGVYFRAGDTPTLGFGATAEQVTVTAVNGTDVTIAAPGCSNPHPTTEGLIFNAAGWSGNPIVLSERTLSSEAEEYETIAHEVGHTLLSLADVDEQTNIMYFTTGNTGTRLRFKDLAQHYHAGTQESQWQTVPRS